MVQMKYALVQFSVASRKRCLVAYTGQIIDTELNWFGLRLYAGTEEISATSTQFLTPCTQEINFFSRTLP